MCGIGVVYLDVLDRFISVLALSLESGYVLRVIFTFLDLEIWRFYLGWLRAGSCSLR